MIFQIGIFVAVSVAALTILRALTSMWQPGRDRIRRRLAGEFATGGASAPGPLYRDLDQLEAELSKEEYSASEDRAATPKPQGWRAWADELLRQAGVPGTPRHWCLGCAGAAVAFGIVGFLVGGWGAAASGGVAGAVAPAFVLMMRRKARCERYQSQLVGAFELMARVLRSGQSVAESFRAAVDAFEDPLSGEFGRCLHQIEHGIRPEVAYGELSERAGVLELRIFVVAMAIQRQTGGNLAEVLDRLAGVVRIRLRMKQRLKALTAEGRLQSVVLVVLPPLTFGVMYFLNRPYASQLLVHTDLLAATAACMTVGVLWIRNIMKFEG